MGYRDNAQYLDVLYASNSPICGYMNMLFGRGIFEEISVDAAMEIAAERGKSEVIYIEQDGYMLKNISMYDNTNPKATQIWNVDPLWAANMTNNNWD